MTMKTFAKISAIACTALLSSTALTQIVGVNAYMIGNHVEIGVDEYGMEGTDDWAGWHSRGEFSVTSYYGFVANPQMDGWGNYDGDFFTPGTPENGFGLDIDGAEYANNADAPTYEIPTTVPLTYEEIGDCIIVTWEGAVSGIGIKVVYKLIKTNTFYTTRVTMWNISSPTVNELYYYRNFDPDNNETIGWGYDTDNTIVENPDAACFKAIVSAEQSNIWDNYVGLGAIHPDIRVCYGGFTNRDGSALWNFAGFTGTEGSSSFVDEAISLSYKIEDFAVGDTTAFEFAVILDATQVDAAINSLYFLDYAGGSGPINDECAPIVDTVETCTGYPVTISVNGPDVALYSWTWAPPTDLSTTTGPTTEASPITTTTYTVTGTSITGCTSETIIKTIVVSLTDGPQAGYDDPGPQCGFFDINDLVWYDLAGVPGTVSNFFTVVPDSADQTGPLFTGPLMDPTDVVYLMIGDTTTGCYSVILIDLTWGGLGAAGNDSTISICQNEGTVDLDDLLFGASPGGIWDETTSSGAFNTTTAVFDPAGVPAGIYTFTYLVPGLLPCPDDVANFTVTVLAAPDAEFYYEIAGLSSEDGNYSGCLINDVDMFNESTIGSGGTIGGYVWDFGDASPNSTVTSPSYNYSASGPGTYTITLTVTATNGCVDSYDLDVTMYENPVLDLIFNDPNCFGFNDGSVTVNTSGGSGSFTIIITDESSTVVNPGGSNTANTLPEGWYYINVDDGTGCSGIDSVYLDAPDPLVVDLTLIMPACYGDQTGVAIVDTVLNVVGSNNTLSYFWNPNPSGQPGGEFADTSTMLGAGDYTLTVNTESGCTEVVNFTITEPEELVFAEIGYEPAYCRLFPFQSGNGVVFAAASGGTPDYTYEWTELSTGDTEDNTTWGGLNPGDYQMVVTDDNGCTLTQIITLDSLNPIAAFTPYGDGLDMNGEFCHGLVPIDVSFSNQSLNFANPNDPLADTTFFWHYGYQGELWQINHDYSAILDTSYTEKGTYTVCLVAQNKNGCTDTACTDLILCDPLIFAPVNVFTPDLDGINDVFTFEFVSQAVKTFNATILDRWGVKIYEITEITQGWDGTDKQGNNVTDGVYFYYYEGTAENGDPFSGQGNVQVLKGAK